MKPEYSLSLTYVCVFACMCACVCACVQCIFGRVACSVCDQSWCHSRVVAWLALAHLINYLRTCWRVSLSSEWRECDTFFQRIMSFPEFETCILSLARSIHCSHLFYNMVTRWYRTAWVFSSKLQCDTR